MYNEMHDLCVPSGSAQPRGEPKTATSLSVSRVFYLSLLSCHALCLSRCLTFSVVVSLTGLHLLLPSPPSLLSVSGRALSTPLSSVGSRPSKGRRRCLHRACLYSSSSNRRGARSARRRKCTASCGLDFPRLPGPFISSSSSSQSHPHVLLTRRIDQASSPPAPSQAGGVVGHINRAMPSPLHALLYPTVLTLARVTRPSSASSPAGMAGRA